MCVTPQLQNVSQGAAWLQSQATSAAAAAAAALSASDTQPHDSAAAFSAAGPSLTVLPAAKPASKHRRHTSSVSFSTSDQAAAAGLKGETLSPLPPGHIASDTHRSAPQAADMTAGPRPTARTAVRTDSSSAPLTAQESLDKATAALKTLQQRYLQASSEGAHSHLSTNASAKDMSGRGMSGLNHLRASGLTGACFKGVQGTAAADSAVLSSRSKLDFRLAVSGSAQGTGAVSMPQAATAPTHARRMLQSAGSAAAVKHTAAQEGSHLSPSKLLQNIRGSQPAGQEAAGLASDQGLCHAVIQGQQPQPNCPESDAMSHHTVSTGHGPDSLGHESVVSSQHPHGPGVQSGSLLGSSSSILEGTGQSGGKQPRQHRCGGLSVSEESSQEVDIYNLQSPEPVMLQNSLVSTASCRHSFMHSRCVFPNGQGFGAGLLLIGFAWWLSVTTVHDHSGPTELHTKGHRF